MYRPATTGDTDKVTEVETPANGIIEFTGLKAGTYYLNVEYELGGDRNVNPRVVDTIEVIGNPVPWSNYVLVILFLLAFPLFSRWRRNAFEAERWNESDLGGGDSEDEDE